MSNSLNKISRMILLISLALTVKTLTINNIYVIYKELMYLISLKGCYIAVGGSSCKKGGDTMFVTLDILISYTMMLISFASLCYFIFKDCNDKDKK